VIPDAWRGVALGAILVLQGCSGDFDAAPADCEPDAAARCYDARFFEPDPGTSPADCAGGAAIDLGASASVRLFRGAGAETPDVQSATRPLARYYAHYGLSFHTSAPAAALTSRYLITGSSEELSRALDQAGIPRERALSAEEQRRADEVIARVLFEPLREFLLEHATSPDAAMTFAVFEQVVDPSFAEELGLSGVLTGLGLSPSLFRRLREQGRDDGLAELLQLPEDFTAAAFVAHEPLAALDFPDNAVAHEVGHALGLPHVDDPSNLMHPNVGEACRAVLTPDQAAALVGIATTVHWHHQDHPLVALHRAAATAALRPHAAVSGRTQRAPVGGALRVPDSG
jgi:hypothetical protein